MKKAFVILSFLFAIPCISKAQTIALDGIYTEYKQTLLNGEDGSDYTIDGKPFKPSLQFVFNSSNDTVITYNNSTKYKQTYRINKDTLILSKKVGRGVNEKILQTIYLISTNNKAELILSAFKTGLDDKYFIKKFYFKKTNTLEENLIKPTGYEVYTLCEEMPNYIGGLEEMKKFISEEAKKSGLKEKEAVYIKLTINPEGKIAEIQVLNTPKTEYVKEAIKITKKLSDFTPGKQSGKAVWVYYNFPVKFNW